MSMKTMDLSIADGIANIRFTRPGEANTLNPASSEDLLSCMTHCRDNNAVRAVILSAEGKVFCGGGDLGAFEAAGENIDGILREMLPSVHGAVEIMATMDAPVIAAVNGSVGGGGLSILTACSMVIASPKAKFNMAYTSAGLTPDGSSTFFLPRLVGMRRAMEMVLTNRTLNATEAAEWGLINRVVEEAALMETVEKIALQFASGPTKSYGAARRLLMQSFESDLKSQLDREGDQIVAISHTRDTREGIRAFIEKRRPEFTGQ